MRTAGNALLALVVLVGLAGSLAFSAQRPGPDPSAGWVAPGSAAGRPNPLVADRALLAGGAKVFQDHCAQCHGPEAGGSGRAPDLTSARVQSQSDGALFWKISRGNAYRGMPTFSFLPQARRWQLVHYLRVAASSKAAR